MITAAAYTAGRKPDDGSKIEEATSVPPSVQAGSTWPRALRIDVELAENHARKTGAGGLGRIDEKNHRKTLPTRRPSKQSSQPHLDYNRLAEGCGGVDEKKRKVGVAGLRVDLGLAESHVPAVSTAGGIGQLRNLLENPRHRGTVTRSTGRRLMVRGNVVIDGEDKNMPPGDGVSRTLGGGGGGGANGDKANDAAVTSTSAEKCEERKIQLWSEQEGTAMAGGPEAAVTTGGVDISSGSREVQGPIKRLRRGGVRQEKVNDDRSQIELAVTLTPGHHHHRLEPHISINEEKFLFRQHQHHQRAETISMDEVAALMSQAMATVAMASAISAAAETTASTSTDEGAPLVPPIPPPPAAAAITAAATASIPQWQGRGQNSYATSREANTACKELRNFANEIDGRCAAAVKALHAASRAVASPGEELNQSYKAYSHAYCSLQAAEGSVRDAEAQEDAAIDELRMVGEAVEVAEREVARAAKTLRVFSAGQGNFSSSNNTSTAKKEQQIIDVDDDDHDDSDREGTPTPALCNEADPQQNSIHKHRMTRESLMLALGTARSNAARASAEQYRAQENALAAMTLVGARTAGEWSLAAEVCDAVKKRFQRAGLETIPKIKLFSEEARLFRNLSKLRSDTGQKLSAASQARVAARVAPAEEVASTVARGMSAQVAAAVAVKAAAEAAARAAVHGGEDVEASLSVPVVTEQEEEREEERKEEGENMEEGNGGDEGTRQ